MQDYCELCGEIRKLKQITLGVCDECCEKVGSNPNKEGIYNIV